MTEETKAPEVKPEDELENAIFFSTPLRFNPALWQGITIALNKLTSIEARFSGIEARMAIIEARTPVEMSVKPEVSDGKQ